MRGNYEAVTDDSDPLVPLSYWERNGQGVGGPVALPFRPK